MKVTIEVDGGAGPLQEVEAENVQWSYGSDGSVIGTLTLKNAELSQGKDILWDVLSIVPFTMYTQIGNSVEMVEDVKVISKGIDAKENVLMYYFTRESEPDEQDGE